MNIKKNLLAIGSALVGALPKFGKTKTKKGMPAPTERKSFEVSLKDRNLPSDEFMAKTKLGRSFFTRQLPSNTRLSRIAKLTKDEHEVAVRRGWIAPGPKAVAMKLKQERIQRFLRKFDADECQA